MSTTTDAFTIINSGGVRMVDCVSEGAPAERDVYLSAAKHGAVDQIASNPAVRSFTLDNFHIEHKTSKESIYVNMPAQAAVRLTNVYWNTNQQAPVIRYLRGQLDLVGIGWWAENFRISVAVNAPRIRVTNCHAKLRLGDRADHTKTKAGPFELLDPLPGNEVLVTRHIEIRDPSQ